MTIRNFLLSLTLAVCAVPFATKAADDAASIPVPPPGTRIDSVLVSVNGDPITMLAVFLETLQGMNREGEAFTVRVEGYHQGAQEDFIRLIRSLSPDVPTGIFATTDYLAFSFMHELAKAGLGGELGRHLFLIGYDDNPMASIITPGLTTIHQPFYELGYQGIELLISKIMGRDFRRQRLSPELVIRGTA